MTIVIRNGTISVQPKIGNVSKNFRSNKRKDKENFGSLSRDVGGCIQATFAHIYCYLPSVILIHFYFEFGVITRDEIAPRVIVIC